MQHLHTKCSPEAHSLSSLLALNHSPWQVRHLVLLAKSLQSCPTLWNPMDYNTPGSSIHGIHQARILEWQEYWSGLPCPSPGDLPNPGLEPASLMSCAMAGGFFTTSAIWQKGDSVPPFSNPLVPHPRSVFFQPHSWLTAGLHRSSSLYLASSWQRSWTCYKATWSWRAAVHRVVKSWTRLSNWTTLWQNKKGGIALNNELD